ncbi:unnamed protein product [Lepeophtheirus salmonis]|uniref:(salmon louse) hypothetical protein n=1 Tax=Lepeophtheirus salmonis TaxID=72036 RepID=A0A7R8CL49_LEPSM|nr:unnamed protein product [Lepeophtheirus salmonis]CAF2852548.1 unnamed protein product [Lepeophtheirus salmonis]
MRSPPSQPRASEDMNIPLSEDFSSSYVTMSPEITIIEIHTVVQQRRPLAGLQDRLISLTLIILALIYPSIQTFQWIPSRTMFPWTLE